ncbi:hypothetical protein D7Z54_02450 [Salibacterium salarium]|uniref:Uncharacterized protein n=1 Tax=Salibacterium salarium TaxID=284579 RepID=A0A3R9RG81_9BACI|nr:hypothetical protein [Salibacterium salarium]RSL34721.1 hypothetical protein D7Z54_02450 [Salibacterium salarium]
MGRTLTFGEFTFVLLICAIAGVYIFVQLIKFAAKELGRTLENTTININIENKNSFDTDKDKNDRDE